MTKTQRRRSKGIYINKTQRRQLRDMLKILHGNRCCWCHKPMLFPKKGEALSSIENMATIEHHFAKDAEEPAYFFLLRLSHKKCNR